MIQRGEDQEMAMDDGDERCVWGRRRNADPRSRRSRMLNLFCQCQQTRRAALRDVVMGNVNLPAWVMGGIKGMFEINMI